MSLNIGFILIVAANLKTNPYLSPNLAKGSLTVLRKIVNTRAFFGEKHDNSVILLPFFGLLITEATLQQLHKHKKDIKPGLPRARKAHFPTRWRFPQKSSVSWGKPHRLAANRYKRCFG
ncbi:MAG: hypothetical protein ACLUNW_01965 [Prevotella sp.]